MSAPNLNTSQLEDTLPVWRKIYQVISKSINNIPRELVEEALIVCKGKLVEGLLEYEPYTLESLEKWKRQVPDLAIDLLLISFVNKLSLELDLDATTSWSVLCNFLLFEYYGKVHELKFIIRYETDMKVLIDHVWEYYTGDRMFLLKTLRFLLEKYDDPKYAYHKFTKNFINEIDVNRLWENLVKIYKELLMEIKTDKAKRVTKDILEQWVHRNNREKVEILMIMIHILPFIELEGTEFEEIVKLFMIHGFTRYPVFSGSSEISRPRDLFDIKSAEIGVLLVMANRYRAELDSFILSKDVQKNLEYYELQGTQCHGCLLIWLILKNKIEVDDIHFNHAVSILLGKRIFKIFNDVLSNPIFSDCKPGLIVIESSYGIMVTFFDIIEDYSHIFEEDGVVELICKFFRHPTLDALELLGPLFDLALERFPHILEPFLDMCLALMHNEKYFSNTIAKLRNIPTFCSSQYFVSVDDVITTKGTTQLFRGSNLFIIPPNTVTYKTICERKTCCRFDLPFDFFLLVEQYMKSFVMFTLDQNTISDEILRYLTGSYKFLIELVKLYKGDLRNEADITSLMRRLDCIPGYFSTGDFQDVSFFKLYFEAKVTIVTYDKVDFREAFPLLISKRVFPQLNDSEDISDEITSIHPNTNCLLFKFLKLEETTYDHGLLVLYIDLIVHIVEKNEYHREIQIPGMWYVLNIVFPLHRQWSYREPHQQAKLLRGCLRAMIKILQRYPAGQQPIEGTDRILYEMCVNAFMHENWLISTLWSIMDKNRYNLHAIMQQESNWLRGSVLDILDCVKLELVLTLLLFKHRIHLKQVKWCAFDDQSSSIAKSVSVQLVNPYTSIIGILALKVLNELAKNDSIPLLASLGLDHDQVQRLFLDRLREPMEDEDLKLNVLEFIGTCIQYQYAMTASFFNIQCSKKWYSDYKNRMLEGDTMEDFVGDYLDNIEKSHEYLSTPLQVAILRVVEKLWVSQTQHLVKKTASTDRFWNLLVKPLRCKLNQSPEVYAHILKILTIQLRLTCRKSEGQEPFLKNIEAYFLDTESLFNFKRYILVGISKLDLNKSQIENYRICIRNFSELIMKSEKQNLVKKMPDKETKYHFVELCFEGFDYALVTGDMFEVWTDFCLVIFDTFGLEFENKNKFVIDKVIRMCSIFSSKYQTLSFKNRKVVITLIHKMVVMMKSHLEEFDSDLIDLFQQIGPIFDYEYKLLAEEVYPKIREVSEFNNKTYLIPWMLWMTVANTVLKYKNCVVLKVWFSYHCFLKYAMSSLLEIVRYKDTLPLGKLIMHTFILYVKSPMVFDMLTLDLKHLFDTVEPHVTTLLVGNKGKVYPIDLKEGWIWATLLFQFMDAYMKHFQKLGIELSFTFMKLNEKILDHIMFMIECTVDLRSLDLTICMLKFFDSILNLWNVEWYRKSNETYNFMLKNISKLINGCIYVMLRPKTIALYFIDEHYRIMPLRQAPNGEKMSDELMICIMNRVLVILEWSLTCLYKVNPNILEMLDYYQYEEDVIELIDDDFSVPKFELPVPYKMNYGRLLCLAHFLCKIMGQLQSNPNQQKKPVPDANKYSGCCALIENTEEFVLPTRKVKTFLRYMMCEYSSVIGDSWICDIDVEQLRTTTEKLMLFLGQHVFLRITALRKSVQLLFMYKRNLYSELLFLNEYVKQRCSQLLNPGRQSSSTGLLVKVDMDVVKSYLIKLRKDNNLKDAADRHFLVVASHWIFNFCEVK